VFVGTVNLITVLDAKNAKMLFFKMDQEHVKMSVLLNFTKFPQDNNANLALIANTAWNVIPLIHLFVYHVILLPNIFFKLIKHVRLMEHVFLIENV